jgi:hypothetical protein
MLGKLLSRLLEQLPVELNNDSNKLLKLLKREKRQASKPLQRQPQKKE